MQCIQIHEYKMKVQDDPTKFLVTNICVAEKFAKLGVALLQPFRIPYTIEAANENILRQCY